MDYNLTAATDIASTHNNVNQRKDVWASGGSFLNATDNYATLHFCPPRAHVLF